MSRLQEWLKRHSWTALWQAESTYHMQLFSFKTYHSYSFWKKSVWLQCTEFSTSTLKKSNQGILSTFTSNSLEIILGKKFICGHYFLKKGYIHVCEGYVKALTITFIYIDMYSKILIEFLLHVRHSARYWRCNVKTKSSASHGASSLVKKHRYP